MKFSLFTLLATLIPCTQATTNFAATVNVANNQMSRLSANIGQIRAVAMMRNHPEIVAKCDEARQHLGFAQSSWRGISSGFQHNPWKARDSTHGQQTIQRLNSCGGILQWIYTQPEVNGCDDYAPHVHSCQSSYDSCQSSCGQIWNWPCPPSPSQYGGWRRHRRATEPALCPVNETACPIKSEKSGYECIDVRSEITSCGGCESLNQGENCMAIVGADEVGCQQGVCRVFSALPGFRVNPSTGRPEAYIGQLES